MIEVEVHQQLRAFLREQGEPYWPHHLTMARLVARALRLKRSALIQAGAPCGHHGRYRLSYLVSALIWSGPVILVVPEAVQQRLLTVEIPRLRQWMQTQKAIRTGDRWPHPSFQGLLLTTPTAWLADRLTHRNQFPAGIPTIVDGVDDLEAWTHDQLTTEIQPGDWDELMLARPDQADLIRDAKVQLTRTIFQHPVNPYECCLVEPPEQAILDHLYQALQHQGDHLNGSPASPIPSFTGVPEPWQAFGERFYQQGQLIWAEIARRQGQFSLHCGPVEVASALSQVWPQQPVVLIGAALDLEADAPIYRQRLGLEDQALYEEVTVADPSELSSSVASTQAIAQTPDTSLTCIKFSPSRQAELIQLYLPDGLPMPNTPHFQPALVQELRNLLSVSSTSQGLAVLLVGDMPLKAQVGSILASEFGSRVQVEKTCLDDNGILVTGWDFWRQHQGVLPAPHLLVIATLPIPSLEHPLVAGRVAYYKQLRQDWFRLYLLPEALSELQRAIAPVRECQGVVALLDSRVVHRSYGHQVLAALSPLARINYLDPSLFAPADFSILD